jgi:hypothetical protein
MEGGEKRAKRKKEKKRKEKKRKEASLVKWLSHQPSKLIL